MTKRHSIAQCSEALITLIIFVVIVLLYSYQYSPPQPKPIDAPQAEFSSGRAEKILYSLVGENIPHPANSEQNEIVKQRVISTLTEYGYQVEIQQGVSFSFETQGPVPVKNIMVRLKGTDVGPAVMLAAHYDSVPDGPGAADDGVGVAAVIEIARMLKTQHQPKNDVIFLLTDGEESGLLGSYLFAYKHPWAKEVGVVINLDARGTSGPSIMFETSKNNRWLIEILSQAIEKPFTSSLAIEIYKRLPNDTDFTHFRRALMEGYNFAFIGGAKNYHTPNDSFEVVSRGSLQHHGENMYSLVQVLKNMDITSPPNGEAVYFDIFGWKIIWWPAQWSIFIALGSLLMLMVNFCLRKCHLRTKTTNFLRAALSIPAVLGSIVLSSSILWVLNVGLTALGHFDHPWISHPAIASLCFWLTGLGIMSLVSSQLTRFLDSYSIWLGVWVIWATLAIASSLYFTGASYLFIAPTATVATVGLAIVLVKNRHIERNMKYLFSISAIVAAVLWLPYERVLYDGVGFSMNLFLIARIGVVSGVLIPVFVSSWKADCLTISKLCLGLSTLLTAWFILV